MQEIRRARPLLGTFVEIRASANDGAQLTAAIDAGFREIDEIDRLMSFHRAESQLSRLNACAADREIEVDVRLAEVLALALEIAEQSDGRFDPTIGADLARCGALPPGRGPLPASDATWRDVRLDRRRVAFARPLWIDLGGIAKGYAVDRAMDILLARGCSGACVNAGGDLRVSGAGEEIVHVRGGGGVTPLLALQEGSVASSSGHERRWRRGRRWVGPHLDGRTRRVVGTQSVVTVVAPECALADALTKVVLADRRFAGRFLQRHSAAAWTWGASKGWRELVAA